MTQSKTPATAPSPRNSFWEGLVARAARLDRAKLAWGSIALAAIALLSINTITSTALKGVKADLTAERLFTISEGTKKVLASIDEPIQARVYFSKALGDAAPVYQKYFDRVRALLEQYRDLSRGRLQLEFIDPEPFSDAEDQAVSAGLKGVRINREGDTAYFGLAAANSTDNTGVIEFFAPERERFLEYDITKIVWSLANPKKRIVGLISGVSMSGGMSPQGQPTQPWVIMEQIQEFFEVKELQPDVKQIPADVDVLMIAQPEILTEDALYAIDQFALKGGRILAFVDPLPEHGARGRMGMMMPPGVTINALEKLFKAWGIGYDKGKVAGDLAHARRVQFGGGRQPVVTEYVAWLGLDARNLDDKDVLSGGVERMNFGSPGILEKLEGAGTEMVPILKTSAQAMVLDADKLRPIPDPVALLRAYQPGGKPLVLAARFIGEAKTAFPDGAPTPAEAKDEKKDAAAGKAAPKAPEKPAIASPNPPADAQTKSGRINVIVVADTDMLSDQFWVEVREMFGQRMAMPHSHNAAFVMNALENLTGGEIMARLRGRGIDDRPFERVDEIRRDSERRFREKEQSLAGKLKTLQEQLASIETKGGDGKVILAEKDKQAIETFRREMVDVRRELRDVKLALRKDIDRLDGVLKVANIAGVPIAIGLGALLIAWLRRRPKP
jgi:ABC-type uncharacterized transport system involved in gliding motility auxiliary subunit